MSYADAMRLAGRRASRDLVPQDIDYGALGVPVIFPDAHLAPQADPDRRKRLAATVMTPILALHMALTGDGDWLGTTSLEIHPRWTGGWAGSGPAGRLNPLVGVGRTRCWSVTCSPARSRSWSWCLNLAGYVLRRLVRRVRQRPGATAGRPPAGVGH